MRRIDFLPTHFLCLFFMRRFKKVRGGGGIYACSELLFGNDINIKLNEIGKEILLMEITKTKPMYVGVDEVCADWGVSRSKGYAIIKQLSDQMKAENPKLLTMAGKINRFYYEEACMKK